MKITFLGAVEGVTGSRYLLEHNGTRLLVDCGLFQGDDEITKHNKDPFPIDPKSIDAVIVTHAHIDHSGYIPFLVKKGFSGKVYCSKATYALCEILLIDSGSIQEGDARKTNEPPTYTLKDAQNALTFFKTINYDTEKKIGNALTFKLIRSGHILGSSFVVISYGKKKLTFSGDLGRPKQMILKSPPNIAQTDYLVLESTYGNKLHQKGDPLKILGELVNKTIKKGGVLLIPSFAVERTQTILYCLYQLQKKKEIPDIPIFLDSPMAISVTDLYCGFKGEYKISQSSCRNAFGVATYTREVKESKKIDYIDNSTIIIAGSGMASGGRILDHFKHFISSIKNTILLVGFQAEGTIGRALVEGAKQITIDDKYYEVRAEIALTGVFSAHADYNEILEWLGYFESAPKKIFITHGEKDAAHSLQKKIKERFGWSVIVPAYSESFDLD